MSLSFLSLYLTLRRAPCSGISFLPSSVALYRTCGTLRWYRFVTLHILSTYSVSRNCSPVCPSIEIILKPIERSQALYTFQVINEYANNHAEKSQNAVLQSWSTMKNSAVVQIWAILEIFQIVLSICQFPLRRFITTYCKTRLLRRILQYF